ncbi:FAD/NAD(P)-binding oxidoreductase [Paenibacillus brasilensis]|uniref:NADPH-dependent 2,4-dienoyl-CoA reductase/sulfur reductase-like enzyme n=1 Tax=Paenibacillus brasilensis TaxID=128574 RepID=A0ABU0L7Z1_9BACL|nr:FAD/NAD(P)-binding oxidoreductase [Paenibacillus brasilensis]MDQ0497330.1 NADPH-dependent 2,4-dienoyl-CoA reductase/sulfur reductase-like enzyme [Paenibacillus brasilensis]
MVNPATGKEHEYEIKEAEAKKKVMVVGGGAVGMEAAIVAAKRGHDVTIYEKNNKLGGQWPDEIILALGTTPISGIPGADKSHVLPQMMY